MFRDWQRSRRRRVADRLEGRWLPSGHGGRQIFLDLSDLDDFSSSDGQKTGAGESIAMDSRDIFSVDDFVNSPISALRFIALPLRRTASTPRDTRFARLDLGLFTKSSIQMTFYESISVRRTDFLSPLQYLLNGGDRFPLDKFPRHNLPRFLPAEIISTLVMNTLYLRSPRRHHQKSENHQRLDSSPDVLEPGQVFDPVKAGVRRLAFSRGLCRAGGSSRSRSPLQQTLRTQVLVDIWPVNAVASSRDPPVGPLPRRRMEQTGEPGQRSGYSSPVIQINTDSVLRDAHIQDTFTSLRFQSNHSKPPLAPVGAPI